MNLWRVPSAGLYAPALGGLVLALSMPGTCLAQAPGGGLAAHTGTFLGAFWGLLGLLVVLLGWEFIDRRSSAGTVQETPGPEVGQDGQSEAAVEEEDPFKALLKKSATPARESPVQDLGGRLSDVPVTRPGPVAPHLPDQLEELSPFQRLAQIGSEEVTTVPSGLSETRAGSPSQAPAASGGGDWAALLNKVHSEEDPPALARPLPEKALEEDPWKKLLGQTASGEAQGPVTAEVEKDPWKALLSKASTESSDSVPHGAPATSATPQAPSPRIQLDQPQPQAPPSPPAAPTPPGTLESDSGRPRSISLDLKREEGRAILPPPQTEDE